jgi:hypothetical protein
MVRFINPRIRIQPWINHDSIDQVVDYRSNVIDAAKAIIQ